MKQIFFTWIYAGQQYVFLIFVQWFLFITYHHARTPIFQKKYKSVFLIYPSDREVACLNNSRREAQCSHGLMFIDFLSLSQFTKDRLSTEHPRDPCTQELWMQFSAARGHTDRCDISTQHSTSSLSFPSANVIIAPIPALMSCRHENDLHLSLPASLSFYSFIPDAHLALAFKLLRWAALQSEAEKSQLAC